MEVVLESKPAIDQHLARLRRADQSVFVGPGREWLDRILDLHRITVDRGRDYWCGEQIPLRYPLSLLDDDERRSRVSTLSFDVSAAIEQRLLTPRVVHRRA